MIRATNVILAMLIGAVAFAGVGCMSVKKRVNRQAVFTDGFGKDKRELLITSFATIELKKTTLTELHEIGLKPGKNVKVIRGATAFRELLGQEVFRNINHEEFQKLLPDLSRYTMYQMPWIDVSTVSDRFYMNKQKIEKSGYDVMLTVILYDDIVVYKGSIEVNNNTLEYKKALFSGIIAVLGEFGQAVSGSLRLVTP